MTDYLVDNSVWAMLASGDDVVAARLRRIERAPADLFVTCPFVDTSVKDSVRKVDTPTANAGHKERVSMNGLFKGRWTMAAVEILPVG